MKARPQLWVFAGPNGAGKSTLVARFHVADRMALVNPDNVAHLLKTDNPDDIPAMLRAGRIAALQRRALLEAGQSFAIETTLTGHSEFRVMAGARHAGYKITLIYVGVSDALTSLARVRERVARGGHDIPGQIILRRYVKSLSNLPAAIQCSERIFILDNTSTRHRLLATIDRGQLRHQSVRMPDWAKAVISGLAVSDGHMTGPRFTRRPDAE